MRHYIISGMLWLGTVTASAQEHVVPAHADSIRHISEVVVSSRMSMRQTIPSATLKGEELRRMSSLSVADALRYFSGLQLKDYGGVGGIKTVNIRSMGSNHLGVFYDGIELGNAQNGQIDLGQFSLDNVEEISLYNGQKSAVFQPAVDFGNAGSVYIRTRMPRFADGRRSNLVARVKYGSSDTFRFSTLWEQRLGSNVSSSLSAGVLTSSGRYKFRYRRVTAQGTTAYDTTAVRHNGDMWAFRVEGNVNGQTRHGLWSMKAYTYNSERGIPGAIVSNVWRRGERQWDHNTFVQGMAQQSVGRRFTTKVLAKYAYYDTRYVNNDTTQMHVDNTFRQQEVYVSWANVYELTGWWSLSASYDFKWNKLNADLPRFAYPHRYSNYVSVATAADLGRLKIQASLMNVWVKDHARNVRTAKALSACTPALFVSLRPFDVQWLSLRAFAKRSYRMPTFNDLYYTDVGNANLRPESAVQYDMGVLAEQRWSHGAVRRLMLQADGYYNTVHDKIVAYPKGQQFRWTMLNLGRVHIKGLDVQAQADMAVTHSLMATLRMQYTYQDARDVTSPATSYYRDQIPYIPWHSGSVVTGLQWRGWDLTYSMIYTGERYSQQENISYNHLQPWYTSDMTLAWHDGRWRVRLDVNNLFSQDYDVILNYPMPKRNYMLSVEYNI
ncbi:MAG: TonB-dependent receptor plug domain-containing protein [Prevotella sp.]|nr:TonB-dependent receptor plug domain-containing protein [Prevotella sp.]